jgi:predicted dehydrogenase
MSADRPRVLLLSGGKFHKFDQLAPAIAEHQARRFNIEVTFKVADLNKLDSGNYAACLLYANQLEDEDGAVDALIRFVEKGGGLVGLHGGNNCFKDREDFGQLIGSRFIKHGPVTEFIVRPIDQTHPVTTRTGEYRVTDELYLNEPKADYQPLAVAYWQGTDQVMAYARKAGDGRVVYLANGHDERSVNHRHVQRLLERALRVACGETFDRKITAGVLGYGGAFNMGLRHGEAVNQQHNAQTVAVCDIDPKRVEQARSELGEAIKTYTDPQKFLADGEFDLCIQILPHNLHADYCIKALEAGKHVVTEKPFCITLDEADRMLAAAHKHQRMLSCYHNRRWDGDFRTILQLVRDGAIGQVFRVDAASAKFGEPRPWWRSSKEISGGSMYDWGAHYMDWTLNIMNKRIKSVTGDFQPNRRWHQATIEDYTYALVRFEDDTTATLEQGNLAAVSRDGWRILGSSGGLSNPGPGKPISMRQFRDGRMIESHVDVGGGDSLPYYQNVINHLIMDEQLVVTPEQARRAIGVIYLAEQSAMQGGKPLELPGESDYEPDYMLPW